MPLIFSEADLALHARLQGGVQPDRPLQSGQDLPDPQGLRARPGIAYRPHPLEEKGLAQRF